MRNPEAHSANDPREQAEALFHDGRVGRKDPRRHLDYAYESVQDLYGFTDVPDDRRTGNVLEIGCFRGERARKLSGFTGRYVGVDISEVSIDHCCALGLPEPFRFIVDNANELRQIGTASIDYAFGDGVLHHLELERFVHALDRVLKRDGCARFIEPALGNFAIRFFRHLTPKLRTPDEHPFDDESIALLRRHFDVSIAHHGLLRPWLPMLAFNHRGVTRWTRSLDDALLAHARWQRQAWLLLIELRRTRSRSRLD